MSNIISKILNEILEEEGNITGPGEATATSKLFKKVNKSPISPKTGSGWDIKNPNKSNVNKNINIPLCELEIEEPPEVTKAAERLAMLLNRHGRFGALNNTSDSILDTILNKRCNEFDEWFEVSNASGLPEDKNIRNVLMTWRNQAYNKFKQNVKNSKNLSELRTHTKSGLDLDKNSSWANNIMNESRIIKLIQKAILNEASYSQFKKEVKFRSKNEMLHKGIKTIKSKLQEVDRIVEYINRMKQELSENEESIQYWDKTKQSINKIQELVETLNNKIKEL